MFETLAHTWYDTEKKPSLISYQKQASETIHDCEFLSEMGLSLLLKWFIPINSRTWMGGLSTVKKHFLSEAVENVRLNQKISVCSQILICLFH